MGINCHRSRAPEQPFSTFYKDEHPAWRGYSVWWPVDDLAQWPGWFSLGRCAMVEFWHDLVRESVSRLCLSSQCILGSWSPLCCCSFCFLLSKEREDILGVLLRSLGISFKDYPSEKDVLWQFVLTSDCHSFLRVSALGVVNLVQNIKKMLK